MAWSAKPYGPYSSGSDEWKGNLDEIGSILTGLGYTVEAISGVVGNVMAESGTNPWRWQSDQVNVDMGYGLFQYTPASGYFSGAADLPGFSPNRSTETVTEGATPEDGQAQVLAFANNTLGKWVSSCWRSYWSQTKYPELYDLRKTILDTYGDGSTLSMAQFATIDDLQSATFAFLACFEGPAVPNLTPRYNNAALAYEYYTGNPPTPPTPPTPHTRRLPLYMMCRRIL